MRLIRVFPRRTKATPNDALAYFDAPDMLAEADEVHVDCTFTYDKPHAERLAEHWRHVAPVKVGGVAYGDRGDDFVSGRYIKPGYVFTSRGCPQNRRPAHVHIKPAADVYNSGGDVHISRRPSGNSLAAALRRLERHRPDILDRVLAGELSAHAAMIEAGFRRPS